jgi:uncharacterized membrane protein YphA (DoxX/SURF4 family)
MKSLALSDVYGRLIRLLNSLAQTIDGRLVVNEKLTQQDIAERVGASRDMISRLMKDLVGGGYLAIEDRIIVILKKPPPHGDGVDRELDTAAAQRTANRLGVPVHGAWDDEMALVSGAPRIRSAHHALVTSGMAGMLELVGGALLLVGCSPAGCIRALGLMAAAYFIAHRSAEFLADRQSRRVISALLFSCSSTSRRQVAVHGASTDGCGGGERCAFVPRPAISAAQIAPRVAKPF